MQQPPPDTRDWTFVITDGCPECGFVPQDVAATGDRLRATLPAWRAALSRPGATSRPSPLTWSPVEYACHVRDTCRLFAQRLQLMLAEDDPVFADWDQDATAVEDDYASQEPSTVLAELEAAARATAGAFDGVSGDQWERRGTRSNGSAFTVRTFAVYFLHDVEHHVADVRATG